MTSYDLSFESDYRLKNARLVEVCTLQTVVVRKGVFEDKILIPKPPRNCARCARCGTPVDGPYCQGCALLQRIYEVQPPQYTVNHPIFKSQNDLLNSQNKLMEQMTTLRELVDQAIQKKEEEKRIAEEQAARDRSWKIPICYDDDEDNTIAITPEEPDNSLSMGTTSDTNTRTNQSEVKTFVLGLATFTEGTTVLNDLAALTGVVVLEKLCLAVLNGTRPDLVKTAVGAKFLLELEIF
ncbi:hypothetical protein Tco_0772295 [Tanacetum coccineum]|uniref:Uncharacterized protein n=1 Tax=Tanacetum coccineum TaxID=301880 RepID=A0ABQ4ZHH9_9ASTR